MIVAWRGNIQGRPAALLADLYPDHVPEIEMWELDTQDGKNVYSIFFRTKRLSTEKITRGGETFEVPGNFTHIIETLKFH